MTDKELLQEALDALTYVGEAKDIYSDTIDALRARLEKPEREWVGLTDEDMHELIRRFARYELIRAVEAKLKEKNT